MEINLENLENLNLDLSSIDVSKYLDNDKDLLDKELQLFLKKGGKIHIKKENKGKFTKYCGGKVTSKCISKGKNSSDPKIRKRATFAANSRRWHKK